MNLHGDLRVDWCTHAAAKYAVETWHYSKVLPTPPYVRVGAWERSEFIGVVLFSRGAAPRGPDQFGLKHSEFCELTRVALRQHDTPVSRILRIALKFLMQRSPGIRLIVSYADPNHGHHGGIYQAGGWVYVGQQSATTEYVGPDGKQWHSRMISPTGRKKVYGRYRPVYKPEECSKVKLSGKLKYLMPMDSEMRTIVNAMARPYPKRAGSAGSGTAGNQSEGGGATPTPALSCGSDGNGQ